MHWLDIELNLKKPRKPIKLPLPKEIFFSPRSWGNSGTTARGFRWIYTVSNFMMEMMKFFPRAEAELYLQGSNSEEADKQFGTFRDEGDRGGWADPIYMADNLGLRDVYGQTHRVMEGNKYWGVRDALGFANTDVCPAGADFDHLYKVEGERTIAKDKSWANYQLKNKSGTLEKVNWDTDFDGLDDLDVTDDFGTYFLPALPPDSDDINDSPFNNYVINAARYTEQMRYNQKFNKDALDVNNPDNWEEQVSGQKLIDPQAYTHQIFQSARLWLKSQTDENNELGKPVNEMNFYELAMTRKGSFTDEKFKENFLAPILAAVKGGKSLNGLEPKNGGDDFDAHAFVLDFLGQALAWRLKDPVGQTPLFLKGHQRDLVESAQSKNLAELSGEERSMVVLSLLEGKKRNFTAAADDGADPDTGITGYKYVYEEIIGSNAQKANYLSVLMLESRRRIYSALNELVGPHRALWDDRAIIQRTRDYYERGSQTSLNNWRVRESGGTNKCFLPVFFKNQHAFLNRIESFFTPYVKLNSISYNPINHQGTANFLSFNALSERAGMTSQFADEISELLYIDVGALIRSLPPPPNRFLVVEAAGNRSKLIFSGIIANGGFSEDEKGALLAVINSYDYVVHPGDPSADKQRESDRQAIEMLFSRASNNPVTVIPLITDGRFDLRAANGYVLNYSHFSSLGQLLTALNNNSIYVNGNPVSATFAFNLQGELTISLTWVGGSDTLTLKHPLKIGPYNNPSEPDPDFHDNFADALYVDAKRDTLTALLIQPSGYTFKTGKDLDRLGGFTSFMYDRIFDGISWRDYWSAYPGVAKVLGPVGSSTDQFDFTQSTVNLPAPEEVLEKFRQRYPANPPLHPEAGEPEFTIYDYSQRITDLNNPLSLINWVAGHEAKYRLEGTTLTIIGQMTPQENTELLNIFMFSGGYIPENISGLIDNTFATMPASVIFLRDSLSLSGVDASRFFEEWSYQYNNPFILNTIYSPSDQVEYKYAFQQQPRFSDLGYGWDRTGINPEYDSVTKALKYGRANYVSNLNPGRNGGDVGEWHFDYTVQQGPNISDYNQFSYNNITIYSPDELNSAWAGVGNPISLTSLKPPVWYSGSWDSWVDDFKPAAYDANHNLIRAGGRLYNPWPSYDYQPGYQKDIDPFLSALAGMTGAPGATAGANFKLIDYDWGSNTIGYFGKMISEYIAFLIFIKLFNKRERDRYKKGKDKWEQEKDEAWAELGNSEKKTAQRKRDHAKAESALRSKVLKSRQEFMRKLMGQAVQRRAEERRSYSNKKNK